jgi:hypothetical protein
VKTEQEAASLESPPNGHAEEPAPKSLPPADLVMAKNLNITHWPHPTLPPNKSFTGYIAYIDVEGQLYIQSAEQRESVEKLAIVRFLRKLFKKKQLLKTENKRLNMILF